MFSMGTFWDTRDASLQIHIDARLFLSFRRVAIAVYWKEKQELVPSTKTKI